MSLTQRAPEARSEAGGGLAERVRATDAFPTDAEAWRARARLEAEFDLHRDALASYDTAIALEPDDAEAHFGRANVLYRLGRRDDALDGYDAALARDPDHARALFNRAVVLADLRRLPEAIDAYDRLLARDPAHARAHNNRGAALAELRRYGEAITSYDRALALDPGFAMAHYNRANALKNAKRFGEALTSFAAATALNPDLPFLRGASLDTRMILCDWSGHADDVHAVLTGIDAGRPVCPAFTLLSLPTSRGRQKRCAQIHARAFLRLDRVLPATPRSHPGPGPVTPEKIKVAYVSPDFRAHAVAYLTAGLFEAHDRNRFEVYAFAYGKPDRSPMRARLEAAFDRFVDIRAMSDDAVLVLAAAERIAIAVDLAGYTSRARTGLFARRLAPIQVNYLGYPGTMGVEFMDYIVADPVVVPDAHRADYVEKVVTLPRCFQANDAKRPLGLALTRGQAGLPEGGVVYGSFNHAHKLNPEIMATWIDVLRAVEGSYLWLIAEHPDQADNLRAFAAARALDPRRLIFAPRLPYAEHLARYGLVDLVLDTLPFNGGTTTSDALWGGAPVLTCLGETFAGRMAASLLTALGLGELIAASLDDYRAHAIALGRDPARLAALKATVAARRAASSLFDSRAFARDLEAAYERMWTRHRQGLPADHIAVTHEVPP